MAGTGARYDNSLPLGDQDTYGLNLTSGFASLSTRTGTQQQSTAGTGILNLTYFKAPKSFTSATVKMFTGSTVATSATLARIGLWTANPTDGSLTSLVASTTNDTALFTVTTNTAFPKAWSSSYSFVKGGFYAVGVLLVTAGTVPTLFGVGGANGFVVNASAPRVSGGATGQADLPSTLAAGSLNAAVGLARFYAEFS